MRLLRVLAAATGFAALLSQPSAAQDGRQFKDAWFWGAKAGGLLYSSATSNGSVAPLAGAEWLITRTNGGLYVSFDQSFMTTGGQFIDHDADTAFTRPVTLKNLRRFTIAGMVFPLQQRDLHPYAGVGLTLNQIAGTALQNNFTSTQRYQIALDSVRAKKANFSPVFIGGVQMRFRPLSAFVQASASPTQQGFFLYGNGGRAFNMSLETGVRYNVGSSIDRAR